MMETIEFFEREYYMLSNWSAHKVKLWGNEFMTADHAYHYKKFEESAPHIARKILKASSPMEAKNIASKYKTYSLDKWEAIKDEVLYEILKTKAQQHTEVYDALIKSNGKNLIENSPYDSYWGTGPDGNGQNKLGKLWMQIRTELTQKN